MLAFRSFQHASSRSPPRNDKHEDDSGDDGVDAIRTDDQAKEIDE
jgi:hypothetical protein